MTVDEPGPDAPDAPDLDAPGTAEELLRILEDAGLGPRQRHAFVFRPTALLSGLVPGVAITDPATAARARKATARLIARLPDPVPAGVHLAAASIREPGTFLLELTFAWPGGTSVRHWDAEPYLAASRIHEPLLTDYRRFERLHIANRTLTWPPATAGEQEVDFSPELLFGASWTPESPALPAAMRTLELDFSRYGSSDVIHARLLPDERAGLNVDDTVLLSGDTVDPRPFTVVAISADGTDYTFRRI
jgi:hypothetical protein